MPVADFQLPGVGQTTEQVGRATNLEVKRRGVFGKPTVGIVGRIGDLARIPQTDADMAGESVGVAYQTVVFRHPNTHVHLLKFDAFVEPRKRHT